MSLTPITRRMPSLMCTSPVLCCPAILQQLPTGRDQAPARKNPAIQIAFVPGARRKRVASLILTSELLEPVMIDQFRNRLRPAIEMGDGRHGDVMGASSMCRAYAI
jgi:hypothetical protein